VQPPTPQATASQPQRVAVLTALPLEAQAVRAFLTDHREETHAQGTVYTRGHFSSGGLTWEVLLAVTGAGNTRAAMEAERAIQHFDPAAVLFIGVAGGIKDVRLGDVVAATKVYGYESGKARKTFQPRPDVGRTTYRMEQRALAEAAKQDWLQRLPQPLPTPVPRAFVGPIAAGEKVVASTQSAIWKFLRANYGDALAVEMEGRGFLEAAHANQQVEALIVRGISDLIDEKGSADASGSQEVAARNASAFAFEVLAKLGAGDTGARAASEGGSGRAESRRWPTAQPATVCDSSGDWVLVHTRFLHADSVIHNADGTITVEVVARSAEENAAIQDLHPSRQGPHRTIPFAHGDDAFVAVVSKLEGRSAGGRQAWTITVKPANVQSGGFATEINYQGVSADEIAERRASRLLLNNPPPRKDDGRGFNFDLVETGIRGEGRYFPFVDFCLLQRVYADFKDQPELFLAYARLSAIYALKATTCVEQVLELHLGPVSDGKCHLRFRGRRARRYSNVEPHVILIEGDCPLE
jgi:nucleoside phosphorylase